MATLAAVRNKPATIITEAKVFNVSFLPERRRSALLPLNARTRLVPPWVDPRPRGWRCARPAGAIGRLYGAHVEAGVGAAVESRVESDDGRASGPRLSIRRSSRHNDGVVSRSGAGRTAAPNGPPDAGSDA